ncbi:MAG: hypothetical protein SCK28_14045 [Bacillota bacterium]|nr:hypothetical protein [Bacillota bacterium]
MSVSLSTLITLGVAALVLALASSYLLWFGPAARKPFLYRTKELLGGKSVAKSDNTAYQVDPDENLSITRDEDILSGELPSAVKERTQNNNRKDKKLKKTDDELIT